MRYDTEPHNRYPRTATADTDHDLSTADSDHDMSARADVEDDMTATGDSDGDRPATAETGQVYRTADSAELAGRSDGRRAADGSEVGQVTTHEHDARRVDEPATADEPWPDQPVAEDEAAAEKARSDADSEARSDADSEARSDEPARGTARVENQVAAANADAAATNTLWPDGTADSFRSRWREVQMRFVDDPKGATDEAGTLVGEVIDAMAETFRARHEGAREWRDSWDTETLRTSVRRYRDVIDRLLDM